MNNEDIKKQIYQTLLKGNIVEIKDSKTKSHLLGRGYCENLNIINHYIEQLEYRNIIMMFQENEESNLFIEVDKQLEFLGR